MDPVRTEIYKGYEIRVSSWPDTTNGGYVGMYEIHQRRRQDVLKGSFVIAEQAEEAALQKAKDWIDEHA